MAALVVCIAGRFSSTYGAADLGVTNDPGYKLSFTPSWELIQGTDAYADNVIEAIFLGLSQVSLDFITKEIKAGPAAAITPFTTFGFTGAQVFQSGLVGRRATDIVGQVIMSATAGTPAASTPASMTFPYSMLHENVPVDQIYGARHRTIPIRFRILAYANSGVPAYFSAT